MKIKINHKNIKKFVANNILIFIIIFNIVIILILLYFNKITINEILNRFINLFIFWFFIFIFIFVPRRYLKKNKYLRFYIKKGIKKYPEIFYIRLRLSNYINDIYFILNIYIRYYIQRIVLLTFIGTRYPGMWPYRQIKDDDQREKEEMIKAIVMEIWSAFIYLILYIYFIIHNIILFYDTKPIKEILKIRIIGYMLLIGLFSILGKNYFIIYICCFIILTIIYTYLKMYIMYKEHKKEWIKLNPNDEFKKVKLNIISRAVQWYGFNLSLGYFKMINIESIKQKTNAMNWYVRTSILDSMKKKYPNKLFFKYLSTMLYYNKKEKRFLNKKESPNAYFFYLILSRRIKDDITVVCKYKKIYMLFTKDIFFIESEFTPLYRAIDPVDCSNLVDWIDEYYHTLQKIGYYIFAILHFSFLKNQIKLSKLSFFKKIGREQEMGFKILLLNMTLLTEEYDEKKFNYYLNEIMIIFWANFIELKPYSKMAKNYKKIIEIEGGRLLFIDKYLKNFKQKNKNLQMEQGEIIENIDNWINLLFKLEKELKW